MARMNWNKPRVGDLVRLDDLTVAADNYRGEEATQVGVITQCIGTRCQVRWMNGLTTKPQRTLLMVLNYASR